MITIHHLDHSRSHRVLWLLEELELLYELKRYPPRPKDDACAGGTQSGSSAGKITGDH